MPASPQPQTLKVVEQESLQQISDIFNFNQQELQNGYRESIDCYQAPNTFNYLLKDTLKDLVAHEQIHLKFKDFSIQSFVKECLTNDLV